MKVFKLLQENPSLSNVEIGRRAGVSHTAVANMRKDFERNGSETCNSPAETFTPEEPVEAESFKREEAPPLQISEVAAEPATLLAEITARIPREHWRDAGLALAGAAGRQPLDVETEGVIAGVPAAEREALGLALIKLFRASRPKPAKERKGTRHSEDLRRRVIELRRDGHPFFDIAAILGLPASTARAIVQKDARDLLTRQQHRYSPEQRVRAVELRAQGLLYKDIGELLGMNSNTVRSIVKKAAQQSTLTQGH